jgi:hydrogenase/urease accessory protein HupE
MIGTRRAAAIAALVLPIVIATPASAHGNETGMMGVYHAAMDTITDAPALLALVGLSLFAVLSRRDDPKSGVDRSFPRKIGLMTLPFVAAMVFGMVLIMQFNLYLDPERGLLLVALASGILAASGLQLPRIWPALLAATAGYFCGVFTAPPPTIWAIQAPSILGAVVGATVGLAGLMAIASGITAQWRQEWISIALRVIASWVVAISAMMLALSFK